MAYEQVKQFFPKDMGKQKGWCLQNCRLGFRIPTGHYASAKAAMTAGKKNGTFHAGTPPSNVAVPVYVKSSSKYGHVVVSDKLTYYTDGKKYKPNKSDIIGWDEMMDGVRVVQVSKKKSFLPAKGYWGRYDNDERVAALAKFMRANYPKYTPAKALGNLYGDNLWKSMKQFQKNCQLYPDGNTGPKTYKELQKRGFKY